MKHTSPITRPPAAAQSGYAAKLDFKQEASILLTDWVSTAADMGITLSSVFFINSLGLNFIDIVVEVIGGGGGGQ